MKKLKSLLIIILSVAFIFTLSFGNIQVFAEETEVVTGEVLDEGTTTPNESSEPVDNEEEVVQEIDEESEEEPVDEEVEAIEEENSDEQDIDEQEESEEEPNDEGKGKRLGELKEEAKKAWEEAKDKLEAEKDLLESQKDEVEAQKEDLEKQLKEAEEAGDTELVEQLKQQIIQLKEQMNTLKDEMKQIKQRMREEVRKNYTEEELQAVNKVSLELKSKFKDIKVLPVDSVIGKGMNIKFDTPPVIKEGRTLIPVRAISEGFGAEVSWNEETKEVTIKKDDKELVLKIGITTAVLNGEEVQIDVPSEILNSRTIVPLRFIVESLGLKVEWDTETETIEIEEETPTEESQSNEDLAADTVEESADEATVASE